MAEEEVAPMDAATLAAFRRLRKVDMHVHVNTRSPALVEQAEADGFDKLLTLNTDVPFWCPPEDQYAFATDLRQRFADRLGLCVTFSVVNWGDGAKWQDAVLEQLREKFRAGATAVKVWKNIGMDLRGPDGAFVMVDHPQFDPIFDYIEREGRTLIGHIGEPKNCWLPLEEMTTLQDRAYFRDHPEYHMYLHRAMPSYDDQVRARDGMLAKHPNLKFCGAHLASLEWSTDLLGAWLKAHPNACVDFAHRVGHVQYQMKQDPDRVRRFFDDHADQLVYGTDIQVFADTDPAAARATCHTLWTNHYRWFATRDRVASEQVEGLIPGLGLEDDQLAKLYHRNALKWFTL